MSEPTSESFEGPDPRATPAPYEPPEPPPYDAPPSPYGASPGPAQGPVEYPPYGAPPPSGNYYGAAPVPGGAQLTASERTWGGAAHWSALVAAFVAMAFLGPLLVMLIKGNESAYIRAQAVEALNFQLSILMYGVVSFVLIFVLVGFLLLPIVGLMWLVLTILGSIRSANGDLYRYPLTIRIVS